MQKSKGRALAKKTGALLIGACMLAGSGALATGVGVFALAEKMIVNNGKYYLDYKTFDEAKAAAEDLNVKLSEEGSVLLKNDGTLPLIGNETVSVFGAIEDQLQNNTQVSDSVSTAFSKAGFKANPVLADFYKNHNRADTVIHEEPLNFSRKVQNSFDLYNDLAVIVIGRSGAEMNDLDCVIKEEEKETYLGEDQGWEHQDLFEGNDNDYKNQSSEGAYKHKHELQLSDSEQALVKYVEEQNFKHIVFVINSSSAMETYNLENDEKINAVIWIGRPGETGVHALPKIISGAVNPSGKVSDEWYKDFTADPVWQNFGNLEHQFGFARQGVEYDDILTGQKATTTEYPNNYMYPDGKQTSDLTAPRFNGFNGSDFEEDIYLGYKYVETYYQDIYNGKQPIPEAYKEMTKEEAAKAWYEDTVTHPFGQGLSYTDFSINVDNVYVDASKKTTLEEALENPDDFASAEGKIQKYKKLYIDVDVKNTGSEFAGKEVVQIYSSAPYYDGEVEKSAMKLIGFAKTELLKPGKTQRMTIEVNVQDIASYDYSDANKNGTRGYELDYGSYTLYASNSSHVDLDTISTDETDAQDAYRFTLGGEEKGAVYQQLDDFSDRVVANQFSDSYENIKNTQYNSVRNDELNDSSFKVNNGNGAGMTMLSRSSSKGGFVGTFPEPPTVADKTLSQTFVDDVLISARFDPDFIIDEDGTSLYDESEGDWYVDSVPTSWTQAAVTKDGLNEYLLADMAGIDPDSDVVISSGKFAGKTGKEAWTIFMNQLSWDEIKIIVEQGSFSTAAVPSINKEKGSDQDRPNMLQGTHNWCDEVVIASTFNTELAKQEGILTANMGILYGHTGWYGPGLNLHRSAFSGRNNDYYSQDSIHAGLMGAAVVQGAQSRGLNCFLKHFALNDQDNTRNGWVLFVWGSEQSYREGGFKAFQIAMQEGGASGAMSGFARISGEACNINYRLLNGIARGEWGYKGIFITDAQPGSKATASADLMIRCGNDLMLRNNDVQDNYNKWYLSGIWNPELRDGKGGVEVGGVLEAGSKFVYADKVSDADAKKPVVDKTVENVNQYYYARISAQNILYQSANSVMSKNGVNFNGWKEGGSFEIQRGAQSNTSIAMTAAALNGSTDVEYTVTSGVLPTGLTINASTGAVEGIATGAAGDYTFTVTCTVDGWVKGSADYTVKVTEGFALNADETIKVGQEFYATVDSETVSVAGGYDEEISYNLTNGKLPTGLTLNTSSGEIEGTPLEAGTFDFMITVKATKTTMSGRFPTTAEYLFDNAYTLTVEAAEVVANNYTVTFDSKGGSNVANQTIVEGGKITLPENPTKEGYTFKGWYYDENCTLAADIKNEVTENQTLYAGWEKNAEPTTTDSGCGSILGISSITALSVLVGAGLYIIKAGKKKKD